ncbi:outer membrane protein [Pseudoduganella lutea]|nr:outer membrane beta-barrel protein [Pseudoduganella lutea]
MKHILHAAVLAVLFAAGSSGAATATEPYRYWSAHLGANTLDHWDARVDFGAGVAFDGRAELQRGLHGGVQVGHATEHARYELEYERGALRVERLALGPVTEAADGRGHYDAVFANAYRTDRLSESLGTFVGGGIGWGRVELPELRLGSTDCRCFGPASKSGFAWQLRAGLEYRLSPVQAVSLQYTWLALPAPERDDGAAADYERRRFGALSLAYTRRF